MTDTSLPLHGGDLDGAAQRYGIPRAQWLDLSTGINPRPYPVGSLPEEVWTRLPGRAEETALKEAACAYYGVRDPACIVAAPGTQALIQIMPRLFEEKSPVTILGPTYEEHAKAWSVNAHSLSVVSSLADDPFVSPILVVVTPNNPDGRRIDHASLRTEATCRRLLVVDEAFADPSPEHSLAYDIPPNTVILRSFGKFFGLAGVRLGFAIASPPLIRALESFLGPWAVSGPALTIGAQALSDTRWYAETRAWLSEQSARLDAVLTGNGFEIVGGTPLFRLARSPKARILYEHLARKGILVRAFAHTPDALRFGLPADDEGMRRLERALSSA